MKKIIYTASIIFVIYIISTIFSAQNKEKYQIPDTSIRFRIIANSNNEIDQTTKLLIKQDLEKQLFPLVENSRSKEETIRIINNNQDNIKNILDSYNIIYDVKYGQNYFPEKIYKGVTYDAGYYESLVINLGESKGDNWWCVMYPPLCLLDNNENEEVKYTSFLGEIFKKISK